MATTASGSGTEFSEGLNAGFESDGQDLPPGLGPWRLAWRRLRRNRVALFFGGLFLLILVMCALAPVYANDVAHIGPNTGNVTGTINVGAGTTLREHFGLPRITAPRRLGAALQLAE